MFNRFIRFALAFTMRLVSISIGLIAASSSAAEVRPGSQPSIKTDRRLEGQAAVHARGRSITSVLDALSRETGVPLASDISVGDQKVVIAAPDVRISDLLIR